MKCISFEDTGKATDRLTHHKTSSVTPNHSLTKNVFILITEMGKFILSLSDVSVSISNTCSAYMSTRTPRAMASSVFIHVWFIR